MRLQGRVSPRHTVIQGVPDLAFGQGAQFRGPGQVALGTSAWHPRGGPRGGMHSLTGSEPARFITNLCRLPDSR